MERSPKTYAAMGEEDRRQTIVLALNTHYRGQTTAEAFNPQNVRRAAVVGQVGGGGVARDDPRDVARAQASRLTGAGEREQQVLGRGGRAALDPRDDRFQGVVVERDRPAFR
jgi:hypothetical protein